MGDVDGWDSEQARQVFERLVAAGAGEPRWERGGDALEELVATILSQHTSDVNAERAYRALRARFPTWQAVLDASTAELAATIQSGGLALVKARRIQTVLAMILERRGALDLEFLRHAPDEEARQFLETLPGVGPKTAACVLVFALGKPALPVDTHVHRVARRLGLVPLGSTAVAAQRELERQVPPSRRYAMHVQLIRHGRQTCRAQRPACERCALQDICPRNGVAVRERGAS